MDVFALTATLSLQAENFFSTLESAAEAIVHFASDSVQTSAVFDKSMSHVRAISGKVQGSTEEQAKYMEALISTAKEMGIAFEYGADNTETAMNIINAKSAQLGRSTQFTASEVADAFGYMAMAGWDYQSMLSGIDGVVALAAASGEDLARTSDIVTDALTGFGMQAGDAVDFADLLAITSARANTNVSMMGETFKYVSAVAGAYGITAEDTAEAIGLMANAGIKASQAGTALRNVMSRLATNAGASKDKLGALGIVEYELGVDFYNNDGSIRDFSEFIDDLRLAWKGLDMETQAEYGKQIAGMYGMSGFLALMNATDEDVKNLQDSIANRTGSAAEMMGIMIDNLAGDMTIFDSALDAVKRKVGEELTPTIRDFTQHGTSWLDTLLLAYDEGGLDALPDAISTVVQEASDLIDKYLPIWKENGTKIMSTISVGISEAAPILGEVIGTFGDMIGQFLSDNAPTIVSTVSTIAKAMAPGVIAAFQGIFQGLAQALPDIWAGISSDFTGFIGGLLWQMEDSMPLVAHALEGMLGIESKAAYEARVAYEAELAAAAQATDEFIETINSEDPAVISAYFDDYATEDIQYAREIFEDFLAYNNSEAGIASAFTDNSTTPIAVALQYIDDLLQYQGLDIQTLSEHIDGTSNPALIAIARLQELYEQSQTDYTSFSEHQSEVPGIVQTILAWLSQLEAQQGEISHTSSVHDVITNYITNGTPSSSTDTVKGTKAGTGSTASLRVHGPTFDESLIHSRSMFDGTIMRGATMFGWDAQGRPQIGGGEGAEAVVGVNSLDRMIERSVQKGLSGLIGGIAEAVKGDDRPMYIVLDTGALVGGIGKEMDAELGRLGNWRSGGAA